MITYAYEVIDEAVAAMQRKAGEIADYIDQQQQSVLAVMKDWEGTTHDAYNALCDDLEQDLRDNVTELESLKARLKVAADEMQAQDRRGAGKIAG